MVEALFLEIERGAPRTKQSTPATPFDWHENDWQSHSLSTIPKFVQPSLNSGKYGGKNTKVSRSPFYVKKAVEFSCDEFLHYPRPSRYVCPILVQRVLEKL